jgi:hypothetical protein
VALDANVASMIHVSWPSTTSPAAAGCSWWEPGQPLTPVGALGHAHVDTTARYIHLAPAHVKAGFDVSLTAEGSSNGTCVRRHYPILGPRPGGDGWGLDG